MSARQCNNQTAIEGEEHDFKPEMILDYNRIKSAVDKLVHEYRFPRTSRRWPLALFFDTIDIAGHNAFCAWSDHDPNYNVGKSHRRRIFLMQLAEDMVKPMIDGRARNPVGIPTLSPHPYMQRLKLLKLPSLEKRRLLADLTLCFKIKNHLIHTTIPLISSNYSRTRGHNHKLTTSNSDVRPQNTSFATAS